jgi:hypothetical protein
VGRRQFICALPTLLLINTGIDIGAGIAGCIRTVQPALMGATVGAVLECLSTTWPGAGRRQVWQHAARLRHKKRWWRFCAMGRNRLLMRQRKRALRLGQWRRVSRIDDHAAIGAVFRRQRRPGKRQSEQSREPQVVPHFIRIGSR